MFRMARFLIRSCQELEAESTRRSTPGDQGRPVAMRRVAASHQPFDFGVEIAMPGIRACVQRAPARPLLSSRGMPRKLRAFQTNLPNRAAGDVRNFVQLEASASRLD